MFRNIIVILLLSAASTGTYAQQLKAKATDMQDYMYKKEASGGLRVQTNGITLFAEYGWIKDIFRTRLLQVEYTYYIDYRQKKTKPQTQDGRDYIFGFQNHFHTIRIAYGFKRTIADKADRNGVRLSFVMFGGFSLGLLKPYYLNLRQADSTITVKPERFSAANSDRFLNKNYIVSAAPIRYGLNQMQPVPGLNLKMALDFDWGKKDEFVKALEAGVLLDVYYKTLPIVVDKYTTIENGQPVEHKNFSNHFYQAAIYISFQFGKRW